MTPQERAEIRRARMLEAKHQRDHPTASQVRASAAGIKGKEGSPLWAYPLVAKRRGL